jgi:DNA primase
MTSWLDPIVTQAHRALRALDPSHPARAYLQERGVTDAHIDRYRLGYWEYAPAVETCTQDFWNWSRRNGANRLVFPMTDPFGVATGVQVRQLGDKFYQNFGLEPRDLYPMVFGLDAALPAMFASGRTVLVEGVFDYFAVQPYAPDALCTLTANVTLNVHRLISRYCSLAICLYDMDKVGRRAAYRLAGLEVPPQFMDKEDVRRNKPRIPPCTVVLPFYDAHDPADLVKAGKLAELQRLVRAQPLGVTAPVLVAK